MPEITTELASLLQYLLPGFIAVWIFRSFTSRPFTSVFETTVLSLIFTAFIQLLSPLTKVVAFFVGKLVSIGQWNETSEAAAPVALGVLIGVLMSALANSDALYRLARWFRITKETSYTTEWFSTFYKNITYVMLHLKDGPRLYGWPQEWPSSPTKGHFVISQACWVDKWNDVTDLPNTRLVLVPAADVRFIEFVNQLQEGSKNEQQ